jgi:glucosamine kinase
MSAAPNSSRPSVPSIQYLIGVDGGGTGTRARLARPDGRPIGDGEAGPSGLGQGIAQAWQHIQQAIEKAFAAAGLGVAPPAICALGLGLAGTDVAQRRVEFLAAAPGLARIALESDAYTTLIGAHEGRPGAVVAAGTGSIGSALRADGQLLSVGGWGFPIGDEGSGAWLGLRAMRHAHRAFDGRAEPGELARSVWKVAGSSRESLLDWCERAGQHAYAALAPLVFDAQDSDPAAHKLVVEAAAALEAIAQALDPAGALPLVVTGSVGRRLEPLLSARMRARLVAPAGNSADGALRLIRNVLDEASLS